MVEVFLDESEDSNKIKKVSIRVGILDRVEEDEDVEGLLEGGLLGGIFGEFKINLSVGGLKSMYFFFLVAEGVDISYSQLAVEKLEPLYSGKLYFADSQIFINISNCHKF